MSAPCTLPAELRAALREVRSAGVITGAGISAESGIATYRGTGGIYEDPEEGERTVEALSGPVLRSDPDRTWRIRMKNLVRFQDFQDFMRSPVP